MLFETLTVSLEGLGLILAVASAVSGTAAWFTKVQTRETIHDEFERFRASFVDAKVYVADMTPIREDMDRLEKKIEEVDAYAHRTAHDLNSGLQRLTLSHEQCRARLNLGPFDPGNPS